MVLVLVFAGLIALRMLAIAALAALIIKPVRACPACFASSTLPVRYGFLRLIGRSYEWRWCPACGWEALARRANISHP